VDVERSSKYIKYIEKKVGLHLSITLEEVAVALGIAAADEDEDEDEFFCHGIQLGKHFIQILQVFLVTIKLLALVFC
ncbi:hypothetical protein Tco_1152055, partial [Tanacetum coccineum]